MVYLRGSGCQALLVGPVFPPGSSRALPRQDQGHPFGLERRGHLQGRQVALGDVPPSALPSRSSRRRALPRSRHGPRRRLSPSRRRGPAGRRRPRPTAGASGVADAFRPPHHRAFSRGHVTNRTHRPPAVACIADGGSGGFWNEFPDLRPSSTRLRPPGRLRRWMSASGPCAMCTKVSMADLVTGETARRPGPFSLGARNAPGSPLLQVEARLLQLRPRQRPNAC